MMCLRIESPSDSTDRCPIYLRDHKTVTAKRERKNIQTGDRSHIAPYSSLSGQENFASSYKAKENELNQPIDVYGSN